MAVQVFQYDESGYIDWITNNPDGYVINTRQVLDPDYLVLHRASCLTMHTYRGMEHNTGGFTERGYQKICAASIGELKRFLIGVTGKRRPFTKHCTRCDVAHPESQPKDTSPRDSTSVGNFIPSEEARAGDLRRFYELLDDLESRLGGARKLADCSGRDEWPKRGVYFIGEDGEQRVETGRGSRIVRVGTHALKAGSRTRLWTRLSQHKGVVKTGGGNHRGSIFRLIVGAALTERDDLNYPTWGHGNSAPREIKDRELELEIIVSVEIGAMPFLWLGVDDEPEPDSLRGYIERNSIALLSNCGKKDLDAPSSSWLGNFSDRELVRRSGLWNSRHVTEVYDPQFLRIIEELIDRTPKKS